MENYLIICARVRPEEYEAPGDVHKSCNDCGCLVTLSPSAQQCLKDRPDATIICITCAADTIREGSLVGAPPGMAEELMAWKRRN